ncbi:MAG TPA: cell wall hydrolase [Candidatus Evtepia faecavium]|nr:cell wall hydrolase [Candidatus Evtepia faecavium]
MTKTHITSAVILCAALVLFCVHAFAADSQFSFTRSTTEGPAVAFAQDQVMLVPLSAADEAGRVTRAPAVQSTADVVPMEDVPYLSAAQVLGAFFPEATLSFQDGVFTATGENLQFQATVGKAYFSVNQQYYYVPTLVVEQAGALFLPAETLAQSLGCSLTQEGEDTLTLQKTGEFPTPPTYPEEDLYWLSRAIYSESGNQPMAGRIAVGTVILNRVEDPTFPDTIKEVIFAPRQFSPVANGTIYLTPDEDSVIAAKLCLDGAREAEECLYFNVTSMVSWADRSRTYVCTIGDHNFYL